jgi:hypothetical protein
MHFALKSHASVIGFLAAAVSVVSVQSAQADDAFVKQATNRAVSGSSVISSPLAASSPASYSPSRGGITPATPETSALASGGNSAGTLEMGRNNFVVQAQAGGGNASKVGIVGGTRDAVGVFQRGQGLSSNVALVGVSGLSVDVLQRPDSAPVNMLITRLPNGTLDVIQPKGAPPATVVRVPGGLAIVR